MTALPVHLLHQTEFPHNFTTFQARLDPTITLTAGPDIPPTTEILIAGRPTAAQLEVSPNLRALIIPFAGPPADTRTLLSRYPHISVHNLHHNAIPTAESALALLLAAAKYLIPADRGLRQHDWSVRYAEPNPAVLLHGKTALILGYGAIGQHVGMVCAALGMHVVATKRRVDPTRPYPVELHPATALPDLLPRTDVLIITLPETTETKGLIGTDELAALPAGAILVNVGRAAVVDEGALYYALREGKLHAAGLDVWYRYPASVAERTQTPPSNFPFYELDNVVLSPHRGGSGGSEEVEDLRMRALAALLNQAAAGQDLPNRVDLAHGY